MNIEQKIAHSIELLKKAESLALMMQPETGYYLAFSGGKDSQCIYHLAKMAGVNNPIITLYKGMVLVREDKKGGQE